MSNNYKKELKNGLLASVDYIAFTVTDETYKVDDVIMMMGFVPADFVELPRGGFGYKCQRKSEETGISVLYDGAENMGIHVNITGQGVPHLLSAFQKSKKMVNPFDDHITTAIDETVLSMFFEEVLQIGHFSRVDAAIDDIGGSFFSPGNLFDLYQKDQVLSKWRSVKRTDKYKKPGECTGYTVYFGSRESALMLRLYDKALEQNQSHTPGDGKYIDYDWYRWELEYKDERADEFAHAIIDGANIGRVVVGVLSYYIRLIELDDCNRSRCSTMQKWEEFINLIQPLRLNSQKKEKTVYTKLSWLDSQVAPTLATMLLLHDFDMKFLYDMAAASKCRISKSDWELIRMHRPDVYDMYHEED